jgi:hypothetical protein
VKHLLSVKEEDLRFSMKMMFGCRALTPAAAQAGCSFTSLPEQSIHLHEKNIAGPTERSENALHFLSSQERTCVFR